MKTAVTTFRAGVILAAALFMAGCSHTSTYNSAYLAAARRPAASSGEGKVLVVMTAPDRNYVFSGSPTSFTGGGTTLTIPIGQIALETAKSAFGDRFRGGVETGEEFKSGYAAAVSPRVEDYSYEYNQLKNLGFAITPIVRCKVALKILDEDGSVQREKTYASGDVEGSSYMVSTEPAEKISELTHKAIYDLMAKAADEVLAGVTSTSGP